MSETQHAVTLLELLFDIRSNFFNVAGVIKSNNRILVRTPINMLPVRRVQGHGYGLNLYEIFFGLGNRSISDHLGLPRALNDHCLLRCHCVESSDHLNVLFSPVERRLWTVSEEPLQPRTTDN